MPNSDPPRPVEPEHDTRVLLALVLDSQRLIVPMAERLMQAQERRDLAVAGVLNGVARVLESIAASRWTGPAVLVVVAAAALVVLHAAGVAVGDLVELADVAAHAWSGKPHT